MRHFLLRVRRRQRNNKYLELYNPTSSTVFLSQFIMGNCSNGCDNSDAPNVSDQFDYFTFNFPFDAEIAPGGTYIVAPCFCSRDFGLGGHHVHVPVER